jgi:hypothetical protein
VSPKPRGALAREDLGGGGVSVDDPDSEPEGAALDAPDLV